MACGGIESSPQAFLSNCATGIVEFDDELGLFHGEVVDTRDVITFQGTSVKQPEQAFRDSIDDYLEFCKKASIS